MSNLQNTYVIVDSLGRSIDVCPTITSDNVHLYIPAERIRELTDAQAKDPGLWFDARTASEAYLQQELRKLHADLESLISEPEK